MAIFISLSFVQATDYKNFTTSSSQDLNSPYPFAHTSSPLRSMHNALCPIHTAAYECGIICLLTFVFVIFPGCKRVLCRLVCVVELK